MSEKVIEREDNSEEVDLEMGSEGSETGNDEQYFDGDDE